MDACIDRVYCGSVLACTTASSILCLVHLSTASRCRPEWLIHTVQDCLSEDPWQNLPVMHLSNCVLVTQPCPAVPEQKDDGRTVLIRVPAVQKRGLLLDSGWILNVVPTRCLVAQWGQHTRWRSEKHAKKTSERRWKRLFEGQVVSCVWGR